MSEYRELARTDEIPSGKAKAVDCDGTRVAIFHADGNYFAIEDRCIHAEVHLSEGWVEGKCVACPWHGAEFDLETGEALSRPAVLPVKTFPVKVEGERVLVAL